jgi:amino acid permease
LSATQYAHLGQPQTVKVFGILHVVFGVFGVLMTLWTLYVTLVGNPFLALSGSTPQMRAQTELESELSGYTLVSTAIYILITVLILIAGTLLLKGRKSALKYSNCYAWLSIAYKVISVIVYFTYVLPLSREIIMTSSTSAGMAASSMEVMMISIFLGTIVISIIYPILTLVLLNRPKVKNWLANQPG